MKKFFNPILTDKITSFSLILSVIFILFCVLIVLFFYNHLPPFLPLYNKMPWGYLRLGRKIEIFIPIIATIIFFIFNSIISSRIYPTIALLSRLICTTTAAVCFLLFIFVIQIIRLLI